MSGLIYFFPQLDHSAVSDLSRIPVKYALEDTVAGAQHSWMPGRTKGPDNLEGAMFAMQSVEGNSAHPAYDPDKQTWARIMEEDGETVSHFIGFWNDNRPQPQELRRPSLVQGHTVKLLDGNEWLVPLLHPDMTALPRSFRMNDRGAIESQIDARYEKLLHETEKWVKVFWEGGTYRDIDAYKYVAGMVLPVNYRVGVWECCGQALDLFRTDHLVECINVVVGFRSAMEQIAAKKKGQAPQNSPDSLLGVEA